VSTRRNIAVAGAFLGVAAGAALAPVQGAGDEAARSTYDLKCAACHRTGLLGAPRLGETEDWKGRTGSGRDVLVEHAVKGIGKMPPKGGNPGLTEPEIGAVVDYMLAQLRGKAADKAPVVAAESPSADRAIAKSAPPARAKPARKASGTARVNSFNRLMQPASKRNPPPPEDGIHDPESDGTHILQPPRESFGALPKSTSGNRVDWVRALAGGQIAPRFDLVDPNKTPVVMDLNIVREVKGSMPDVVYPHKQHTEWLDCSNCHTGIFVPQKGANQMSMAGILLGQGCGVCHGKVAFPVADCRRCHSRNKPKPKKASN
jgi:c(7)-type cytochrome triheme protein